VNSQEPPEERPISPLTRSPPVLDLLAQQGGVSVLAGNGDGSFGPPQAFGAGDDGVLADVDGDRRPDLILVQNGNPFLRLLHNASR
jgi:hypothetical protein